jgi:hypothetical protein
MQKENSKFEKNVKHRFKIIYFMITKERKENLLMGTF